MNVWLIVIVTVLFVLFVGVLTYYFFLKRKHKINRLNEEYNEVLNDFNLAERMYEESLKGGDEYGKGTNPHTILWEIAKSKRRDYSGEGIGSGSELPPLPKLPPRPDSVPGFDNEATPDYQPESVEYQRRNRKSLFGRRRRVQ